MLSHRFVLLFLLGRQCGELVDDGGSIEAIAHSMTGAAALMTAVLAVMLAGAVPTGISTFTVGTRNRVKKQLMACHLHIARIRWDAARQARVAG